MIVWTGRGFLIVLVFIACMFLGVSLFPKDMADYVFVFAGLLSAIFSWFAGIAWNTKKDKVITDDETGQKILLKGGIHKLFWIPMQYWGIILSILSIIILFQNSIWMAVGTSVIFCAIIIIYKMRGSEKNKIEPTTNTESELLYSTNKISKTEEGITKEDKEDISRFMPK
jgi:protein-S-isoprenylcysteine O-methyltransferase Ste14